MAKSERLTAFFDLFLPNFPLHQIITHNMKTILLTCLATMLLLAAPHTLSAVTPNAKDAPSETTIENSAKMAKKEWRAANRVERKAKKEEIKQAIRDYKHGDISEDTLLLVIITILLPPVGMLLYEGEVNNRFWLSLLLTILFYLPGLIYTLIIILGEK